MIARLVAMSAAQKRAYHHVFENRHVLECGGHLKGASDARARVRFSRGARQIDAVKQDAPCARHHVAGHAIEEGRFACAVWPDQADDLALRHCKIGAPHCGEAVK
jgi:hypothetical protein